MAVTASKITLAVDTPTILATNKNARGRSGADVIVTVDNSTGGTIYLGPSNVTDGTFGTSPSDSNTGLPVATGTKQVIVLSPGDTLYGFSHTSVKVAVLTNAQ